MFVYFRRLFKKISYLGARVFRKVRRYWTRNSPCFRLLGQISAGLNVFRVVVEDIVERFAFWHELAHSFRKVAPHYRGAFAL